jgi:nucleotide-binding universal stress UspA family protein
MKRIITLVDFSPTSLNAANFAADLALAVNAKLELLHIYKIPMAASEITIPQGFFEEMLDVSRTDLAELGRRLALRTDKKVNISTEVVIGTVEHQIVEFSGHENPFAVVMGFQAGKSVERYFFGSNALFTIKQIPYPVLIVPENAVFSPIIRIGLACDLEHVEALPYNELSEWLSVFNASLDIIHVSKSEDITPLEMSESVSLQNRLNKFHPKFHFITGKNLTERLNASVKELKLDLLIIFPKKHGLDEIFSQKHSRNILIHQQEPVLTIHSR